jgi:hypothetical protein
MAPMGRAKVTGALSATSLQSCTKTGRQPRCFKGVADGVNVSSFM